MVTCKGLLATLHSTLGNSVNIPYNKDGLGPCTLNSVDISQYYLNMGIMVKQRPLTLTSGCLDVTQLR